MKKLLSFLIAIVICVGLGSCSANIYPDDYDYIYSTRTVYYPVHHHHGHHHQGHHHHGHHHHGHHHHGHHHHGHHHRPGSKKTHKSSYDRPSRPKSNSYNSSRGGNTRSNGNRGGNGRSHRR